jgi:hypothetical protein
MTRSYHATRKKADAALNQGDVDPTWQASEKAAVKKRQAGIRSRSGLPRRKVRPNRSIVASEKKRTRNTVLSADSSIQGLLNGMLAKNGEA